MEADTLTSEVQGRGRAQKRQFCAIRDPRGTAISRTWSGATGSLNRAAIGGAGGCRGGRTVHASCETPLVPSIPQAAIDVLIGLCAGAGGAIFGARAQWRLHALQRSERRTEALWIYQGALLLTSQWLAWDVEYERRTEPTPSLEEAELAAVPYFHTLPHDLQDVLNRDHNVTDHSTRYETSEKMWVKASKLKEYLEQAK